MKFILNKLIHSDKYAATKKFSLTINKMFTKITRITEMYVGVLLFTITSKIMIC
jgi:hypothetical protein